MAKPLTVTDKTKIAFGAGEKLTGKPQPVDLGTDNLREAFFHYTVWESGKISQASQDSILRAVEGLAEEWRAGSMPIQRQEAIVRQALHGKLAVPAPAAESVFLELAREIIQRPDSQIDWLAPGWTWRAVPVEQIYRESPGQREIKNAPKRRRLLGKKAPSLLTAWLDRDYRANGVNGQAQNGAAAPIDGLRPPVERLGGNPVPAIFEATTPDADDKYAQWASRFNRVLSVFGVENAPSAPTAEGPMLMRVIAALAWPQGRESAPLWMEWIARADTTPWLRFDHQNEAWNSKFHPLEALGTRAASARQDVLFAPAVSALLRMGYTSGFGYPEGRGAISPVPLNRIEKPNALWSFVEAGRATPDFEAVVDLLLKDGVNWRQKGGLENPEATYSILVPINGHALGLGGPAAELWSRVFEKFVKLGADPLDAFPPQTLHSIADGPIRGLVQARQEQKEILAGMSQGEIEQALRLLAEHRARETAKSSAKNSDQAIPAPAVKRNRL